MAALDAKQVDVRVKCERVDVIMRGMHVTDLVTGFNGEIVQERHFLHGHSRMLVAPPVRFGIRETKPRWIDVRRLRVDAPIRRKNAPASTVVRYAHDAQEPIVEALFDFAANLQMRPTAGMIAQRAGDAAGVSLKHVATALDQILAGLGYVKAEE